jgi:hypothetical protein
MQNEIAKDVSKHGAVFVPVVAGSDKTTVSVATGHQEYHPVYMSPGNFTNIARRSHGNALLPVAFLPIPESRNDFHWLRLRSCPAHSIQETPGNILVPDSMPPNLPSLTGACI